MGYLQTRTSGQPPQKGPLHGPSQHPVVPLAWLHSIWFGFVAGVLLVSAMVPLDKLYDYISSTAIFDSAPFGLASVVVALLWGLRPALFTIMLGLIAIAKFISPGLLTPNIGKDIAILAPFVVLQILAVA